MDFLTSSFWYECAASITNLPVFMSKFVAYSTRVSEFCVLKSGLECLHATFVSGYI